MNTPRFIVRPVLLCGVLLACGVAAFLAIDGRPAADVAEAANDLPPLVVRDVATDVSVANAERAGVAAAHAGVYSAPVGARFTYDLTNECSYGFIANGERTSQMRLGAKGELTLQVVRREAGEIFVVSRLSGLAWTANGTEVAAGDPAWHAHGAAATSRVHVRLGEDGSVRGYAFEAGLDGEQRNLLRGLLAPFAFTVPAELPAELPARWEATEGDATGVFIARYQRSGPRELVRVRRSKQRYVELAQDQDDVPEHEVLGSAEAQFRPGLGWIAGAGVDERCRIALPGFQLWITLAQRGSLRLKSAGVATIAAEDLLPDPVRWFPAAGHRETSSPRADAEVDARRVAELRKLDVEGAIADLTRLLACEPQDQAAISELWSKLAAYLALDDAKVADMQQRVLRGELTGRVAGALVTAFGAAGSDAAQRALAAIRVATDLDAELRETACVAMLQLAQPLPEVVAAVAGDLERATGFEGLDATNLRLLGALAARSEAELASGKNAVALLRGLERKARGAGGIAIWLEALGNAARPEVVPDVLRHVGDADPDVRRAAFTALRTLEGEQVVDVLLHKGIRDEAAPARIESVGALAHRSDPRSAEAIRRVAREDAEADVRRAALFALGQRPLGPEDHRLLDDIARLDPDEQNRQFAQQLRRR